MADNEIIYIIDTCALVNMHFREDNGAVWEHFVRLVNNNRVKTVESVSDEIQGRFPNLYELFHPHKTTILVNQYDEEIWNYVADISETYYQLYEQLSDRSNSADPWLIGAALAHGFTIVTDERNSGPEYTHRIPYIASRYGVNSCDSQTFLTDSGYGS